MSVYYVCMSRLNVYVPDSLAAEARRAGLNVSALTQEAITTELAKRSTRSWLAGLPKPTGQVTHDAAIAALDEARAELGE